MGKLLSQLRQLLGGSYRQSATTDLVDREEVAPGEGSGPSYTSEHAEARASGHGQSWDQQRRDRRRRITERLNSMDAGPTRQVEHDNGSSEVEQEIERDNASKRDFGMF